MPLLPLFGSTVYDITSVLLKGLLPYPCERCAHWGEVTPMLVAFCFKRSPHFPTEPFVASSLAARAKVRGWSGWCSLYPNNRATSLWMIDWEMLPKELLQVGELRITKIFILNLGCWREDGSDGRFTEGWDYRWETSWTFGLKNHEQWLFLKLMSSKIGMLATNMNHFYLIFGVPINPTVSRLVESLPWCWDYPESGWLECETWSSPMVRHFAGIFSKNFATGQSHWATIHYVPFEKAASNHSLGCRSKLPWFGRRFVKNSSPPTCRCITSSVSQQDDVAKIRLSQHVRGPQSCVQLAHTKRPFQSHPPILKRRKRWNS